MVCQKWRPLPCAVCRTWLPSPRCWPCLWDAHFAKNPGHYCWEEVCLNSVHLFDHRPGKWEVFNTLCSFHCMHRMTRVWGLIFPVWYTMHSNAQSIKTNRRNESRSVIIICHERKLFLLILHNANQVCDVRNLIIWSKQCRLHKRLLHFLLYVCPPPKKNWDFTFKSAFFWAVLGDL